MAVMFLFAILLSSCHASKFLDVNQFPQQDLDRALFDLHNDHATSLEVELSPMFMALPKNEHGRLEPSTVRYALHRYFVQKHGWFVKGFDPEGGHWDVDTTSSMVKEKATQYIQDSFAKQLNGRGLSLKDLASFAAVVADLIHKESVDGLEAVYGVLDLSLQQRVTVQDFELAYRSFLSQLIVGFGAKVKGRQHLPRMETLARGSYPEYDDIVMWFSDIISYQDFSEQSRRNPFVPSTFSATGIDFGQASEMMKLLVHHFGSLLKAECQTMRDDLSEMEIGNSGRVLLSSFYSNKGLQLHESVDYLRNLGVLEESESISTRLVIPNYISSKSRCLPFSGYYSVCCPDDCQSLVEKLEKEISAPAAPVDQVLRVITKAIQPANISEALVERLRQVSDINGGKVPLHGRLMSQWLHHVSPLACPYPHASGTVKAVSQDEWLMQHENLNDAMSTDAEKQHHVQAAIGKYAEVDALPWSDLEELVDSNGLLEQDGSRFRGSLRVFMGLLLVVSFLVPTCRALASLSSSKVSESNAKTSWV